MGPTTWDERIHFGDGFFTGGGWELGGLPAGAFAHALSGMVTPGELDFSEG